MSTITRSMLILVSLCLLAISPVMAMEMQQFNLDNGLEVLLKEAHGSPMVASIVTVGAGSRFEDLQSHGASHFLEHMVFNGTDTRTRVDINEGIQDYGGYINAFTRRDYTCYILLIPSEYLRQGLEIQADMLFGSTLPEAEFVKEKRVVIEEMNKDYDSGSYRGQLFRDQVLLTGTPYAHPVLGTAETIADLTRQQVVDYYHERYQPDNCRMLLAGDFQPDTVEALLDEVYGRYASDQPEPPAPVDLPWSDGLDYHLYRAEEGTPSLELIWRAPAIDSGEYPAQLVLAEMLSDPHRSPLFQGEEGPLDVGIGVELFTDFSLISLGVDPGDGDPEEVLIRVSEALRRLDDWRPDQDLVREMARGLRIDDIFLQDTYHYFAMMKSAELHLGGYDFLGTYTDDLKALCSGTVRRALENSILAAPPRIIWSSMEGGLESLPRKLQASFVPSGKKLNLADKDHSQLEIVKGRGETEQIAPPREEETRRVVLDNGLTLLVKSNQGSEVFAAHLMLRGRTALEPEGQEGMVSLIHRLLQSGTSRRSDEEIAAEVSALGIRFKMNDNPWLPFDDYYSREDFSWVRMEVLDESGPQALTLLAELLRESNFPEEAVQAELGKMIASKRMGSPPPMKLARQALYENIFNGGLRGRSLSGTAKSLAAISRQDLVDFHREYFVPGNMTLAIVTGLPVDDVVDAVAASFGKLTGGGVQITTAGVTGGPKNITIPVEKEQVSILGGRLIPGLGETEDELSVLVRILSTRMALELREKQGLAYSLGAGMRYVPGLDGESSDFGLISVQISTASENREQALKGIKGEIDGLISKPPSEQEIFRAVNGHWGRQLMRNLSRIHQAYQLGMAEHLGEDPFAGDSKKITSQRNVSGDYLSELAAKYLLPEDWIWVFAGGGLE